METLHFYVSMRSPYSYLATERVIALAAGADVELCLRPVYPIAIRDPEFFRSSNPALLAYLRRDAERVAEMLSIPFAWPDPDPVVQNLSTSQVAKDQPHIRFLTRLAAAGCILGNGVACYRALGRLIFGGDQSWSDQDAMEAVLARAGCDFQALVSFATDHAGRCDSLLQENARALGVAGHWGTPTLVFGDETFFGQDRIDMCAWYLAKLGYPVTTRSR